MTRRRVEHLDPDMFEVHRVSIDDDQPVLQAMFDYAAANPVRGRRIYMGDQYQIASTLRITAEQCSIVMGLIEATAPMARVVELDVSEVEGRGVLQVIGTGGTTYSTRTCGTLVYIDRAWRCTFEGFSVDGAQRYGVECAVDPSMTDTDLGYISAFDCGSAAIEGGHVANLDLAYTARVDSGGDTSVAQYSEVTVDLSAHATHLLAEDIVMVGTKPYYVREIDLTDPAAALVQLYPKIDPLASTSGTLESCHGGAVRIDGGNSSGVRVRRLSATRCGVAQYSGGLYDGDHGGVTAQSCGVGLVIADDLGAAHLSGSYGQMHLEDCRVDVLDLTRSETPLHIASFVTLDLAKHVGLTNFGAAGPTSPEWGVMRGVSYSHRARWDDARVQGPENKVRSFEIGNAPTQNSGTLARSNPTYTLRWDADANRLFGYDTAQILVMSPSWGAPGTVTLTRHASDATGTIEGSAADYTVVPTGPARITLVRDVVGEDWRVWVTPL